MPAVQAAELRKQAKKKNKAGLKAGRALDAASAALPSDDGSRDSAGAASTGEDEADDTPALEVRMPVRHATLPLQQAAALRCDPERPSRLACEWCLCCR